MALDFPSSPVNGQVYDNFIYDSAKGTWKSISSGSSPSVLVNPTINNAVITATATTPSTVPLTVNGAASQSANLQEWKNSAGISLARVSSEGSFSARGLESYNAANNIRTFSVGDDIAGQVEVGRMDGVAGNPYIDFHSGATATDFDVRIQTSGGNGVSGKGTLFITADRTSIGGRINLPDQPMFVANGNGSSIAYGAGTVMQFTSAQVNQGSGYNTSNGRFTAPLAGKYLMHFTIYTFNNGNVKSIAYKKNGSDFTPTDTVLTYAASATDLSMSATYMFNLAAGDYIEVAVRAGHATVSTYNSHSWFMGYMVG